MAQDTGIKIRIRLKAYDHKVIDQSAKQIIEFAQVLTWLVQCLCQLDAALTPS